MTVARGEDDMGTACPSAKDCVIAVSASGTTPYVVAALRRGQSESGASTRSPSPIMPGTALCCNLADIAIHLGTPPEIVAGSTRMGAGTAQKIALNMISTQAGIGLGHIHDGYMVNVQADNAKLESTRQTNGERDQPDAMSKRPTTSFAQSGGSTKIAILLTSGARSPETAEIMLEQSGQALRPALEKLNASQS